MTSHYTRKKTIHLIDSNFVNRLLFSDFYSLVCYFLSSHFCLCNSILSVVYEYDDDDDDDDITCVWTLSRVFTALHGMQRGLNDEISVRLSVRPSVCPSVCLSNACIVTKRKKDMFRFLYHTKEHLS